MWHRAGGIGASRPPGIVDAGTPGVPGPPREGSGGSPEDSWRVLGASHASWQPTGAVPSRFRPHFGGLPTSKSMLPCRRELEIEKHRYFDAEFEKGFQKRPRSTSKRSRGVPRSARRRPRNFPVEGPGAPRGSKGGRLASRTSPQGLGQAWRLHFGSVLEPFSGHCRSQRTLVRRMSGISQRLRRGHSG